jgi:hypothetical protein
VGFDVEDGPAYGERGVRAYDEAGVCGCGVGASGRAKGEVLVREPV